MSGRKLKLVPKKEAGKKLADAINGSRCKAKLKVTLTDASGDKVSEGRR